MHRQVSRRHMLGLLAAAPFMASGPAFARARDNSLIGRLISEAQSRPQIAQRMDHISHALLGIRYQSNTLIGGPRRPEVFVIREDAFDCVTYCEVVLAAARSRNLDEFETALLQIRYENGRVKWEERNHYFGQWSKRAVDNKICQPVALEPSVTIEKTVKWGEIATRDISLTAIPVATFTANKSRLAAGDVIGFVSSRVNLDFYHTGLLMFAKDGTLLLRHASQSRKRVLDEPIADFVAQNRVRHVTLLRPSEPTQLARG